MVAAEQSARQRRTRRGRALGMAASLHRLRLPLPLQRTESERRSRPRTIRFGTIDFASHEVDHINRVGFEYQGDYSERTWAHTTFGYRIRKRKRLRRRRRLPRSQTHGQRLNQDAYAAAAAHSGAALGDRRRALRSQQRLRQHRCAASGADFAGAARRRIVFRNASAFFLRHRIQGAAPRRDFRRAALFHLRIPA